MECNKDEAARAKEIAEKKFAAGDLQGAKKFALKAKTLFPALEGIAQMVATIDIYLASEVKVDGEKDWYSILSVAMTVDDETLKKQYRKLLLQLHPDKNKSVGAEGAFQMVQEAYTVLSDKTKRAVYDQKRNIRVFQQRTSQSNKASVAPGAANGFYNFASNAAASKASANRQKAPRVVRPRPPHPPPPSAPPHSASARAPAPAPAPARVPAPPPPQRTTFWTSCNKCKMNFEYLRVYLNNHLRCPSCREPFLAKEIPMPPTENVVRDSNTHGTNQNASSSRNVQWGPFSRAAGAASATASSAAAAQAANVVHQTYEKVKREREEAQAAARREEALRRKYNPLKRHTNMSENVNAGTGDVASSKKTRTLGKDAGVGTSSFVSGPGANSPTVPGGKIPFSTEEAYQFQGFNGRPSWKPWPPVRTSLSRAFSPLDCRSMLLEKAKNELKSKLKELENTTSKVADIGKASKKQILENDGDNEILASDDPNTSKDVPIDPQENASGDSSDTENEDDPLSYNVPDPDFHDFDKDRTEESFRSDQIWATYDDDDGMPRYYALIREVISLKPFKIKMSFLTSRTNSEFGPLNWASAGFTKTCGEFRIGKYENNDVLNMFSHQIKWEKERGLVKIYPQKGDIWAVYRNWSPDWDDDTPDNVRHVYDVVEVLNDYDEEHGISVIPLVKVAGFRTVFQRHQDSNAAKKIPKEEMFRFSHQVPFYRMSGEEAPNVPKDSYELDPAAISKELLQYITETAKETNGACEC